MRRCRQRGLKVGLRFTLTCDNSTELPAILSLLDDEGIDRFYLSHLNHAGRGRRCEDPLRSITRRVVEGLFAEALRLAQNGSPRDVVTGNNDADGVCLLLWIRQRFPQHAERIETSLRRWGGNASGIAVANIDATGTVHPDTMWGHHRLGTVGEQPFSRIWRDSSDPLLAGLRQRPRPVQGRCGACRYLDLCNGNARVRAWRAFADPWAEDPGCYLTDAEIGCSL
ncbi:MAG: nirJ [Rhodospirillaceae bacterium]|nr:MAG: nirJ [Rhodospirillaceae bacterium]